MSTWPEVAIQHLLDCAALDVLAALARCSRAAAEAVSATKEVLQERFAREDSPESQRCCDLYVRLQRRRLPNGLLHGLERSTCVPYRVGGPGSPSFYAERVWKEGRLVKDAVWETNSWKRSGNFLNASEIHELCSSREYDLEPPKPLQLHHPLLQAMQGLAIYGMPCVERKWQQKGEPPQVTLFEEDEEELASLRERCDWAMQDTASLFAAVDQLLY
ncbi:unnamed protein product [Symbiodinium sp. KB8]|nr:unnamed protein product [Symbiodinium sp. KB8]|mmetsp:Transcript_64399/g.153754  ORF Transcript_64399/g.153754 Transcript_64399/m.153754 type:complete len:217 (+) Transcript_64399:68-718(+)|eukprot:CAMPEP_0181472242 /NCGR_PEP_ID=MMETSP1110-20121109/39498_1 /TAXON_ID=174948 /ORGANISM="Symbiodinium sp., Strain CCMP421" /LENGTH=216 /DNA_ID=CAMNT_0023597303 /DNA_START=62 /DNA_END=712 /DNA_ORIENTATION=-